MLALVWSVQSAPSPLALNLADTLSLSFMKSETLLLSPCPLLLSLKPLHAHEDLPDIKFWTRNKWVASKEVAVSADQAGMHGKSRAAKGENVTMNFIKDTDGQAIDSHKASEIRKVLRELWMEMDQVGLVPRSWSKVTHAVLMNFCQQMYIVLLKLGSARL